VSIRAIHRTAAIGLGIAGALALASPALADTKKETPGAPCTPGGGQGTGNPCQGNNGNPSPEGNVGQEKVVIDKKPPLFTVVRGIGSGAFVEQVGDANRATITQTRSTQYARIAQTGDRNTASAAQGGSGAHYASIAQEGDANVAALTQSGAGAQVAYLTQNGSANSMSVNQHGGLTSSGVAAMQLGDRNAMSLTQNGDNNMARLTQDGSDNAMTAVQNGNNQLTWTQTGSGLSDLHIVQPAGQALLVTQSR
jgi:hypothetical protein